MGFGDTEHATQVGLADEISVPHPKKPTSWVKGKVVALILLADGKHRIRLQLGSGYSFDYDADPNSPVLYDGDPVDYSL